MKYPDNKIIVLDVAGKRATIICEDKMNVDNLLSMGFRREGAYLVRAIADDADRQDTIRELVRMEALFSGGKDWSPAEVLDLYRDQGILESGYQVITWRSPDDYVIVIR